MLITEAEYNRFVEKIEPIVLERDRQVAEVLADSAARGLPSPEGVAAVHIFDVNSAAKYAMGEENTKVLAEVMAEDHRQAEVGMGFDHREKMLTQAERRINLLKEKWTADQDVATYVEREQGVTSRNAQEKIKALRLREIGYDKAFGQANATAWFDRAQGMLSIADGTKQAIQRDRHFVATKEMEKDIAIRGATQSAEDNISKTRLGYADLFFDQQVVTAEYRHNIAQERMANADLQTESDRKVMTTRDAWELVAAQERVLWEEGFRRTESRKHQLTEETIISNTEEKKRNRRVKRMERDLAHDAWTKERSIDRDVKATLSYDEVATHYDNLETKLMLQNIFMTARSQAETAVQKARKQQFHQTISLTNSTTCGTVKPIAPAPSVNTIFGEPVEFDVGGHVWISNNGKPYTIITEGKVNLPFDNTLLADFVADEGALRIVKDDYITITPDGAIISAAEEREADTPRDVRLYTNIDFNSLDAWRRERKPSAIKGLNR